MVAKDVRKRFGEEAEKSFLAYMAAWERARELESRGLKVAKPIPQIGRPHLLLIEAGKKQLIP